MSTFAYDSFLDDVFKGNIRSSDTYYVMLVSSAYPPDQALHTKRADVTGEIGGAGYTQGGRQVNPSFAKDAGSHVMRITFPAVAWPNSSLTARYAVYYKRRGGSASLDELVAVDDFGDNITTDAGTFLKGVTTITINTPASA
jgi:hypothetical protein